MHFPRLNIRKAKKHLTFEDDKYGPYFQDLIPVLYKYDMKPVII